MAFYLDRVQLVGYEYRAMQEGTIDGTAWQSLIFESTDGNARQLRVSVPGAIRDVVGAIGLNRGDICDFVVNAQASAERQRIVLVDILSVYDENGVVRYPANR